MARMVHRMIWTVAGVLLANFLSANPTQTWLLIIAAGYMILILLEEAAIAIYQQSEGVKE